MGSGFELILLTPFFRDEKDFLNNIVMTGTVNTLQQLVLQTINLKLTELITTSFFS